MLRTAALVAIPVGAAGAVALFVRAADHPPPLLVALFVLWLISPFALLGALHAMSPRWTATTRVALQVVTLVITIASLAIYAKVIRVTPAGAAKGAPFVVTAPASWLLIAATAALAALASRRR